jgi:hypothetical protein
MRFAWIRLVFMVTSLWALGGLPAVMRANCTAGVRPMTSTIERATPST